MKNLLKFCAFLSFLFSEMYASCLHAYPTTLNPDEPIKIQADTASIEQLKQKAVYTGNVIMIQGEHELRANELVIKKEPNSGLNVITAKGDPAHFTGKRLNDPHPLLATANIIYYYPAKQLIILEGAATLDYQKDRFEGPTLSYHLEKQVISATSQNDLRPTVILHPRG